MKIVNKVIKVLKENPQKTYTVSSLAKESGVVYGQIWHMLKRGDFKDYEKQISIKSYLAEEKIDEIEKQIEKIKEEIKEEGLDEKVVEEIKEEETKKEEEKHIEPHPETTTTPPINITTPPIITTPHLTPTTTNIPTTTTITVPNITITPPNISTGMPEAKKEKQIEKEPLDLSEFEEPGAISDEEQFQPMQEELEQMLPHEQKREEILEPKDKIALSSEIQLPLACCTEVFTIVGRRGSGKSMTAGKILEELDRLGIQVLIFDPRGAHSLINLHGTYHMKLHPGKIVDAKKVINLLVNSNRSLILNLTELELKDQQMIIADMCNQMLMLWTPELRKPVMVMIEECQDFVPLMRNTPSSQPIIRMAKLGRCLTGDTKITLSNGEEQNIENIRNMTEVMTLNFQNGEIVKREKTDFYEREVDKIAKITLKTGKEIKATTEHSFLTINGWKEVKDLNIGDSIATIKKITIYPEYKLQECEAKILGYLIGDGWYNTRKHVGFCNFDKEIVADFVSSVQKFSNKLTVSNNEQQYHPILKERKMIRDKKGRFTNRNRNPLYDWLEKLKMFGVVAETKKIPEIIFKSDNDTVSNFLKALFSTDGSISRQKFGWRISYTSTSLELIKAIQSLLLRFGIISVVREDIRKNTKCGTIRGKKIISRHKAYQLRLSGESVKIFCEKIRFSAGKKAKRAEECINWYKNERKSKKLGCDQLPYESWKIIEKETKNSGIRYKDFYKKLGSSANHILYKHRCAPTTTLIKQLNSIINSEKLKWLSNENIYYDKIKNIEIINERTKVYDIGVPESHNFIANNIIAHNSSGTGCILITQRPASASKEALSQSGVYIVHKVINTKDLEALEDLISFGLRKDKHIIHGILSDVTHFEPGQMVLYSPDYVGQNNGVIIGKTGSRKTRHAGVNIPVIPRTEGEEEVKELEDEYTIPSEQIHVGEPVRGEENEEDFDRDDEESDEELSEEKKPVKIPEEDLARLKEDEGFKAVLAGLAATLAAALSYLGIKVAFKKK